MRNFFISLFVLILVSCINESNDIDEQACDNGTFVGRISLTTQQEVNDFGALCYTKIDGTLIIYDQATTNDKILDLSPLSNLTEIYTETYPDSLYASLHITTSLLTNLEGLNNLEKVGRLVIRDNESLATLSGLEGLAHIGSNANALVDELFIENNPVLLNLDGLNNLVGIGNEGRYARLRVTLNPLLQEINGLESLSRIGTPTSPDWTALSIILNHQLQNVDGLSILTEVYGDISFIQTPSDLIGNEPSPLYGNETLNDFCGLQNLFSNGIYGSVRLNHPDFTGYGPSVQDIVDGNCSQ